MSQTARSLWEWISSPTSKPRSGSASEPGSPTTPPGGASATASARARLQWASSSAVGAPKLLDGRTGEEFESQVITPFVLQQLAAALPGRFAYADWRLLYSTAVHGISLNTFYHRTAGCGCCVLAIRDSTGSVFGAFCSEWREPSKPPEFYGSGETFLYMVERLEGLPPLPVGDGPPPHEALHVHRWSGENSFFMFSDRDHLAVGSGGHFGLWLDAELLHGTSGPSATFGNECLCRQQQQQQRAADGAGAATAAAAAAATAGAPAEAPPDVGEFRCEVLEVWGMEHAAITRRHHELYLQGERVAR